MQLFLSKMHYISLDHLTQKYECNSTAGGVLIFFICKFYNGVQYALTVLNKFIS